LRACFSRFSPLLALFLVAATALAACGGLTPPQAAGVQAPAGPFSFVRSGGTPRYLLIKPLSRFAGAAADVAIRHGLVVADKPGSRLPEIGWHRLALGTAPDGGGGFGLSGHLAGLRADPAVAAADLERELPLLFGYDDPYAKQQWALGVIGLERAHAVARGTARTLLAILDTGVDAKHPDFADGAKSRVVVGADTSGQAGGDAGRDGNGHGTHVAGIAAASAGNGRGIVGVAPAVRILAVKVLTDAGSGTWASVAEGVLDSVAKGARVLNLSLGDPETAPVLEDALRAALGKDVLVVAAAGNDGKSLRNYPAASPGVMAVGATTRSEARASFSTFGDWLSVAAPGHVIYSTLPAGTKPFDYGYKSGTSMAAPHVAGLAALLRDLRPEWSAARTREHIERTARDLGPAGFDPEFGHGRIDAARALIGAR